MNSDKKIEHISDWIKKYISSLKFQSPSLIIGVSGGIDSAVTSTLCCKTGFKTIAVSMPIKQNSSQHDLSMKHLDWLNANLLSKSLIVFSKDLKTSSSSIIIVSTLLNLLFNQSKCFKLRSC